jgi:hypothetical protein
MTVETSRASTDPVATNGVSREWAFEFDIASKDDARLVLLDATDNETIIDPDDWDFAAGVITYPRAPTDPLPASGEGSGRIRVDRVPAIKQTTNLIGQGAYRASDVERALDRIVQMVQALNEVKDRLEIRTVNLYAALEEIDAAALGDLQGLVDEAAEWASSEELVDGTYYGARKYAVDAAAAQTLAESAAGEAETNRDDVETFATLVDAIVSGPVGSEYEPGKPSMPSRVAEVEELLALGPVTQGRVIGTHEGEAGSDGVTQEFLVLVSDIGQVVRVKRLANRPWKLKVPLDLYKEPPASGFDESWGVVRIINDSGAGSTGTLEGPADPDSSGDLVSKPVPIASKSQPTHSTNNSNPAFDSDVTLLVPAGPDRKFVAYCAALFHAAPSGTQTLASPTVGATSGITVRATDGDGAYDGTEPLLVRTWTGDITGELENTIVFRFSIPALSAATVCRVVCYKNVSAFDTGSYVASSLATVDNDETYTHTPTEAAGALDFFVAHQGADALTGLTLGSGEGLETSKTLGGRSLRDIAYASNYDTDVPASLQTKTGSSDKVGPRAIMGVGLLPVTTSGGGGGEDNLYYAGSDKVLDPKEMADIMLHSSGLFAFLSRAASP